MRRTEKRRGPVWAAPGRIFDLFNDVVVRGGETRELFLADPGKEVNSDERRRPLRGLDH
jgi:hypothetical protein